MCTFYSNYELTINSAPITLAWFIDRNLNPQKIKKAPEKGCLFNTLRVPCEWLQQLNGFH
ncbi:hypothetical protein D3G64_26980 [Escherichia coli]|nr:hypothetical protein [Escherichia coli]